MSQSLANVVVHIVYSTKNRGPWLKDPNLCNELYEYANQAEHHKRMTCQDEFREICKRHDIEIEERYVWD